MHGEPYLETCCRAALHRVMLAGPAGRPRDEKDERCLERMTRMGLVYEGAGGRYRITNAGAARHAREVLGQNE